MNCMSEYAVYCKRHLPAKWHSGVVIGFGGLWVYAGMVISGVYGKAPPSGTAKRLPYIYTMGVRCRTGDTAALAQAVPGYGHVVRLKHAASQANFALEVQFHAGFQSSQP